MPAKPGTLPLSQAARATRRAAKVGARARRARRSTRASIYSDHEARTHHGLAPRRRRGDDAGLRRGDRAERVGRRRRGRRLVVERRLVGQRERWVQREQLGQLFVERELVEQRERQLLRRQLVVQRRIVEQQRRQQRWQQLEQRRQQLQQRWAGVRLRRDGVRRPHVVLLGPVLRRDVLRTDAAVRVSGVHAARPRGVRGLHGGELLHAAHGVRERLHLRRSADVRRSV